ncbi:hypothetical protein [Methanobrevibacter sp.]|uniref:hypothetical protein n=1 Tax=Methanobrevibacter sp. TaxID=66852 RepID=UPI00261BAF7A|nr:hypothetical protein [uncultured Methanobrevibacter sp.]
MEKVNDVKIDSDGTQTIRVIIIILLIGVLITIAGYRDITHTIGGIYFIAFLLMDLYLVWNPTKIKWLIFAVLWLPFIYLAQFLPI